MREDHGGVPHDTALSELFIPALESALPLAVTDPAGRLVGVIPRVTLLATLGGEPEAAAQATPRLDPLPTSVVDRALRDAGEAPTTSSKEARS